ncbi:UDP-N-acetylglucosamine 2-epimerase (non-hydrolyzing) [Acidobacteria bacterium AH-259-L09]|nr:UDP-N-acetylglucosamine 2-epimerase (non-hydrolyzing) [Acidobacteria bacterium AH-259-L09]
MLKTKIFLVAGVRPNFIKVAPLFKRLRKKPGVQCVLVHTGQHYDPELSDSFFHDLDLPKPDVFLAVGSGSHGEQTARIMISFERVVLEEKPDIVVVVGDVNSTLGCALATAKVSYEESGFCPTSNGRRPLIAHVEAGLRSFDRSMPEEVNRMLTDALSDFLFTPSSEASENLCREGISESKIFFVGNVMIDTLLELKGKAQRTPILERLGLKSRGHNEASGGCKAYAVCTLHRPSNVDHREIFRGILEALKEIGRHLPIICPVHPRTLQRIQSFELGEFVSLSSSTRTVNFGNPITCVEPLGYLDFLHLMSKAKLVLTDSGGIQEETTVLGIPCVTIRENTERPVTITAGTNILARTTREDIVEAVMCALQSERSHAVPEKWDGRVAERIVNILLRRNSKVRVF